MDTRKLWIWLYNLSREKYKKAHLNIHKNDIKCGGRHEWFSINSIDYKHEYVGEQPEFGIQVKCGRCNTVSYYNLCIAPVAIYCDSEGVPIE